MVTEEQVHEAFRTIIKNADAKALNYAVNYAKHGLSCTEHELHIQTLYVRSNLGAWRGEEAREVKKVLEAFTKQNKR